MKLIVSIKRISLLSFSFMVITFALAQNNPGYLGYKKSVDLTVTPLFFNFIAGGPTMKPAVGLAYEMATKSKFSIRFGLSHVKNTVSQDNLDYYALNLAIPNSKSSSGSYDFGNALGEFNYSYTAFSIAPRFFKTEKGAVAPYGGYWGFDLAFGNATVANDDNVIYRVNDNGSSSNRDFINDAWKKVKVVSLQFNVGKRRYFGSSGISAFYQMGVGYPLWQNSKSILTATGTNFQNHQDLLENAMIRHIANGSIMEIKFGVGYGIK
jgi:hypothetical protein